MDITYSDRIRRPLSVTGDMISGFNLNVPGAQAVTIAYNGFTYSFTVTVIKAPDVIITCITNGNSQSNVDFAIKSADGKGYTVYIYETGAEGSFRTYNNVNYNLKGAHIKA